MPTPIAFTITTLASENAAKTHTMMAAALVMRRPLRARPSVTAPRVVAMREILLLDATQEEHLVVHRQTEHDAEEQHGERGLDRTRLELEHGREMTFLEDPHERPERRSDGEEVRHDRFERQDDRAKEREQDEVGERRDERDRGGSVLGEERVRVDVHSGEAADEERPIRDGALLPYRAHRVARERGAGWSLRHREEQVRAFRGRVLEGAGRIDGSQIGWQREDLVGFVRRERGIEVEDAVDLHHARHRGQSISQRAEGTHSLKAEIGGWELHDDDDAVVCLSGKSVSTLSYVARASVFMGRTPTNALAVCNRKKGAPSASTSARVGTRTTMGRAIDLGDDGAPQAATLCAFSSERPDVDPVTEHREQRGQQRQGRQHGQDNDDAAGNPERRHVRVLEEEQPR